MRHVTLGFQRQNRKQQSFFSKVSLNSCLIGFDQLYTGRGGVNSKENAFNKILSTSSQCLFTWRSGNETASRAEGPKFDSGQDLFFFFFSFLFFFPFLYVNGLLFSYCSFVLFFYFLYSLSFLNQ